MSPIERIIGCKLLSYRCMIPIRVLLILLTLVVGVILAIPYVLFVYVIPNKFRQVFCREDSKL